MSDIGFAIVFLVMLAVFFPEKVGKAAGSIRDAYAMPVCGPVENKI